MVAAGPLLVTVLCVVPLGLWVLAGPLETRFAGLDETLTSVASLLGLAGVSAFALNLVLGGRLKPLEGLFGGLDRLYRAHRVNGRIAFLLLLGHGVVMSGAFVARSGAAGLRSLLPIAGNWTVTLGVIALAAMAVSIGLTLYARLAHEVFVYVQRSFGVIFVVAGAHVFFTPGTKASSTLLTFYLAGLFVAGIAAWMYRSVLGRYLVPRRRYRIESVGQLGPSVIEVTMVPEDGPIRFMPGQFIYVTFESEGMRRHFRPFSIYSEGEFGVVAVRPGAATHQQHPFSITSSPNERALKIVVKAVGDYTAAMSRLESGARVLVEGPYGGFSHLRVPNPRQVWIAGGIGLTPFLSMARSLEAGSGHEIDFYYCMEDGHQGYFLDELYDIADRVDRLRVAPIRRDRLGFISASDIAGLTPRLEDKDILICGPPAMLQTLRRQLIERGVPDRRIHFEQFGFV